jgi:hypothetical protein
MWIRGIGSPGFIKIHEGIIELCPFVTFKKAFSKENCHIESNFTNG